MDPLPTMQQLLIWITRVGLFNAILHQGDEQYVIDIGRIHH